MAERGVKMIQDFINTVTNDEEQLQGVMQLVETHRKQVPDFKKTTPMTLWAMFLMTATPGMARTVDISE